MFDQRSVLCVCLSALATCTAAMAGDAVQWRVEDGGNGHWYRVVQYAAGQNHAQASALAAEAGARLVSIGSEPELVFLEQLTLPLGAFAAFTLGGHQDLAAPDYSEPAGGWRWDDGTPWTFTNWDCGACAAELGTGWWCQPDNYINQHYLVGVICSGELVWDDGTASNAELRAIYEWSADCNNDGIVDYGQILSGELADSNDNNVPDVCDCASDSDGDLVPDCQDGCPTDPARTATVRFFRDADADGFGNPSDFVDICSTVAPEGYVSDSTDCDDSQVLHPDIDGDGHGWGEPSACGVPSNDDYCPLNPELQSPLTFYYDGDHDGFGWGPSAYTACSTIPPIRYVLNGADCDDTKLLYADTDADGFGSGEPTACGVASNTDGCPDVFELQAPVTYYRDADSDSFGDAMDSTSVCSTTAPPGYVTNSDDCDDTVVLYVDSDSDGFGSDTSVACSGVGNSDDCDDTKLLYPDTDGDGIGAGAPAACGVESNTDGCPELFELQAPATYYRDADSDSFGDPMATTSVCSTTAPAGYVSNDDDCNDAAVLYGDSDADGFGSDMMVACDGVANSDDCDDTQLLYTDGDLDGHGAGPTAPCGVASNDDCNDNDASIFPGALESCSNDGIDNDCDGIADDTDTSSAPAYYPDYDCDGYPSQETPTRFCTPPLSGCWVPVSKWVNNFDCNDVDASVHPDAIELCYDIFTDNNCNGVITEDECADATLYFRDADGDGFGHLFDSLRRCTQPDGYVANSLDCDDAQLLYADEDSDGVGAGAPVACGVASNGDLCALDPGKIEPGVCGCGTADSDVDADGRTDCRDVELHMSVLSIDRNPDGLVKLRVEARTMQPVAEVIGMQCAIAFDAARMHVVDVSPVVDGPLSAEIAEMVNDGAGTIRYALGDLPPDGGFTGDAVLFDVTLQFWPWADLCAWTELARLTVIDGAGSALALADGTTVQPSDSWNTDILLDVTAPTISGVPDPIALPFDAGWSATAFVDEWNYVVLAQDRCGALQERIITLPNGTVVTDWPWYFPAGITTIRYRAWDPFDNSTEVVTTITVLPYQLLDATFTLDGAFDPALPAIARIVRIGFGPHVSLQTVSFVPSGPGGTQRTASLVGAQMSPVDGLPCMQAKDIAYSLSDVGGVWFNGTRYAAEFNLRQGDSNDDNAVDILDFGAWYVDVGPALGDARSNYNSDGFVNNADFGWIGVNFFLRGETCAGVAPPGAPLARISVKELRRRGLGDLARADVNRDGWLDQRDVELALSGATPPNSTGADAPTAAQ